MGGRLGRAHADPPDAPAGHVAYSTVEIFPAYRYNTGMSDTVLSLEPGAVAARYDIFLTELAIDGNASRSAKAAGYPNAAAVHMRRGNNPEFAAAWAAAIETFADRLEDAALRRAVEGVNKPVVYQGQLTYEYDRDANGEVIHDLRDTGATKNGEPVLTRVPRLSLGEDGKPIVVVTKEYSDSLLLALLKAKRPKEYRDNTKIELANAPGETFKTEETPIQSARKIAFALALGLRNVEKGEDLG